MIETKLGTVTFTHQENYVGEVEIERGGQVVKVPFEALQKLVAEKVRCKMIASIEDMPANDILGLATAKK
jgi:hypothetical protein